MESKQFIDDFEADASVLSNNTKTKKPVKTKTKTETKPTDENEVGPSVRKIPKCLYPLFPFTIIFSSKP